MSSRLRELMLGPTEVSPFMKGCITLVCMTGSAMLGFYVQQRLIERYYSGEAAELHQRVKAIQHRELQEIAARGGADARAAVPDLPRGELALLRGGGILKQEQGAARGQAAYRDPDM